jgi:predicted O-linked N-acetylglucosamine transferase (SPINDLY family)
MSMANDPKTANGRAVAAETEAMAHVRAGRMAQALPLFEEVAHLMPQSAAAARNCGTACLNLYRNAEARDWFAAAERLDPADADAALCSGTANHLIGALDDAVAAYDRALSLRPGWYDALLGRANVLQHAGRLALAEEGFNAALAVRPGDKGALNNLGNLRADQARHAEALALFQRAASEQGWLFTLNYDPDVTAEDLAGAYRAWGQRNAAPLRATWPVYPASRASKTRLRVGFVSCDLRNHSMRHFLLPALANLDKARIDLVLYSATGKEDAVTARYRACASAFVSLDGVDDATAAARIAADGIDILVDASGHTAGNRLTLFARKPAPVQVTWLAYGTTTGVDAIDWFLADARLVPPGGERYFAEGVWRLRSAYCYAPPENLPPVAPLPATKPGAVTFGCFSRTIRLNGKTLAAWGAILAALPESRLKLDSLPLVDDATRAYFAAALCAAGAAPGQLELGYTTPQPRVWDAYAGIDIALDPFPHNAGATTFEALWLGVPVVSKRDRIPLGRFGDSILGGAGLGDWVTDDVPGYVARAIAAARDIDGLRRLRATLRNRLTASPLGDTAAFGRELGDAFHAMWTGPKPEKP